MSAFVDLTGKRFGRLVCLSSPRRANDGKRVWLCQCDCGSMKEIVGRNLTAEITKSCGCLHRETVSAVMSVPFDDRYEPIPETGCWLWTGGWSADGYGLLGGRGMGGIRLAHRYSYSLHHGEIPKGMVVMHRCDTPSCVNPGHLMVGTHHENSMDRDAKGRDRWSKQRRSNEQTSAV